MTNPLLSLASFTARLLPDSLKQALYRSGPLAGLIRGALNWAALTGIREVRVASGGLRGARLLLDLQSEKDLWLGTYEPELQRAIRDFIEPGMVVYDVGANIGYVTLLLARALGSNGRVFAFEALPDNVERLGKNLALNPEGTNVTVLPKAVTEQTGTVQFQVHQSGGMGKAEGSAGRQTDYEGSLSVPSISLDDFVYAERQPAPQAIKLDIEGGEVLALPGIRRVLAEARPQLFLELHGPESAQAAWKILTAAGYTLHQMKSGYPQVHSVEALEWKAYLIAQPPR